MILALTLPLLSACAASSADKAIVTAAVPGDCEAEFNRFVQVNNVGAMNKREVVNLILRLDQSQKAKSRCGRRIISNLKAMAGVR